MNAVVYGLSAVGVVAALAFPELTAARASARENGFNDWIAALRENPWLFALVIFANNTLLAGFAQIVLTSMIENVQRSIPGRVSDPRDVAANSIGMFIGIVLALVLTLPATVRRRRDRAHRQPA